MKSNNAILEALFYQARFIHENEITMPYGFSTRVAALGMEVQKEQRRMTLAWRMAWVSLLPSLACLAFILLSQGNINEILSADMGFLKFQEELFLP